MSSRVLESMVRTTVSKTGMCSSACTLCVRARTLTSPPRKTNTDGTAARAVKHYDSDAPSNSQRSTFK